MNTVYQSKQLQVIHELASEIHEAGFLDKKTMREFDIGCLTAIHPFTSEEIKALREREEVSQSIFALYLGVTKDSVSQWERGIKKPAGAALKLLSLVRKKGLHAVA
jgi:putative transcriptional regulator